MLFSLDGCRELDVAFGEKMVRTPVYIMGDPMSSSCCQRVCVTNWDSSSTIQMYSLGEDVASRMGEQPVMEEESGISQLRRQWCQLFRFGWCSQLVLRLTIVLLYLCR